VRLNRPYDWGLRNLHYIYVYAQNIATVYIYIYVYIYDTEIYHYNNTHIYQLYRPTAPPIELATEPTARNSRPRASTRPRLLARVLSRFGPWSLPSLSPPFIFYEAFPRLAAAEQARLPRPCRRFLLHPAAVAHLAWRSGPAFLSKIERRHPKKLGVLRRHRSTPALPSSTGSMSRRRTPRHLSFPPTTLAD
jgi:hypothetical protein